MAGTTSEPREAPWIMLRTRRGETVAAGGVAMTPESLVLTLRLPFGAFVWQRPTAVAVEQDGQTRRLPIHDATRLAQCALIGAGLLALVAGWRASRQEGRRP